MGLNIIEEHIVKTHKDHKCWGCRIPIPIGTTVYMTKCADAGTVGNAYWCEKCNNFMNTLDSLDTQDGFSYGELLEYDNYPKEGAT